MLPWEGIGIFYAPVQGCCSGASLAATDCMTLSSVASRLARYRATVTQQIKSSASFGLVSLPSWLGSLQLIRTIPSQGLPSGAESHLWWSARSAHS